MGSGIATGAMNAIQKWEWRGINLVYPWFVNIHSAGDDYGPPIAVVKKLPVVI